MKFILLTILIGLNLQLLAQFGDSLGLDTVVIKKQSHKVANSLDSIIQSDPFASVAEILTNQSVIQVNNEGGKGAIKTLSIRGLTSSHTNVRWNGLNMNSLTLGLHNFGGMPSGVADEVSILKGNGVSDINDVSIGGVVVMDTKLKWNKPLSVSLGGELGSFGFNAHRFKIAKSTRQFSTKLSWSFQKALNNYEYINHKKIGFPIEEQAHADFGNKNLIYSMAWKNKSQNVIVSNHNWFGTRRAETPKKYTDAIQSTAYSVDSTIRSVVSIKALLNKIVLVGGYGINHERYLYNDIRNQINTHYVLNNHHLNIKGKYQFKDWRFNMLSELQIQSAKNNQYEGEKNREVGLTKINVNYRVIPKKLNVNVTVAHNSVLGRSINVPVVVLGYSYKLKGVEIKGGGGNHFRLASFNDSFWPEGGNEALEPEQGWSVEQSVKYNVNYKRFKYQIFGEAYYSIITNWIQWQQGDSFWSAQNLKEVKATGAELNSIAKWTLKKWKFQLTNQFAYTSTTTRDSYSNSNDGAIGKQIIYVPLHKSVNHLRVKYKGASLRYSVNFFGIRYTTSDNLVSKSLPSYLLHDLTINKKFLFKKKSYFTKFTILNLFNKSYEGLTNRPMPGRAYYLTLIFNLN